MTRIEDIRRLEEAAFKRATCSACLRYNPAPSEDVRVPIGWCDELRFWTEPHIPAADCDGLELSSAYMEEACEWRA